MQPGLVLVLAVLLGGCLGSDPTFPDESAETADLRINAYTDVHSNAPHDAIIELSGAGADNQPRAFRADIRLTLARQENGSAGASYHDVQAWTLRITPAQFGGQTVPIYKHVVSASDFPAEGTYRARATGTIDGRPLEAAALFAYVKEGVPAV